MTRAVILTHSGRLVGPEEGHPSLHDIARGLARQPRFGGQTEEPWSVLDHSMFCEQLVIEHAEKYGVPRSFADDDEEAIRLWRLAMLLHDAHEALTGDVPTPLKTGDMQELQRRLDERIMNAYFPGGYFRYLDVKESGAIGRVDHRAMTAEAHELLPHDIDRTAHLFGAADPDDVEVLRYRRPWGPADYVDAVVRLL